MQRTIRCVSSCALFFSATSLLADSWQEGHFSVTTDFVYMERYHVKDKPLVVDSEQNTCNGTCASNRVLDTKHMIQGYKPGIQASLDYRPSVKNAYQLRALYLWELDNTSTRTPDGVLSVPFKDATFAESYSNADRITARYTSQVYTEEVNFWRTFSSSRNTFLTMIGVFGLRFANVSEHFYLTAYKNGGESNYNLSAKNNLLGPQVGFNFQIHPSRRFYWELQVKAGVDLNRIDSKVYLGNLDNTETLRNYKKNKVQGGTFAEAAVGAGAQLLDYLNLHIGYQMLFFGGLALAPDQISYSSTKLAPTSILSSYNMSTNGYIIVHGIYSGITFSF